MSKKRVKISFAEFMEIRYQNCNSNQHLYFLQNFQEEAGLVLTSTRRVSNNSKDHFYFFKIVDKTKYFLAKIKYGF